MSSFENHAYRLQVHDARRTRTKSDAYQAHVDAVCDASPCWVLRAAVEANLEGNCLVTGQDKILNFQRIARTLATPCRHTHIT